MILRPQILVTFSDHCFTREKLASDPDALIYPHSSRRPGYFCLIRYRYSLSLVGHLERAKARSVWNLGNDVLALLPVVEEDGTRLHYMIVFSLLRLKSRPPFDLHMEVKSAYPFLETYQKLTTFGEVGFAKMLSLKMRGSQLTRNTSSNRKRPKPPA
jgi:hypothetical protein